MHARKAAAAIAVLLLGPAAPGLTGCGQAGSSGAVAAPSAVGPTKTATELAETAVGDVQAAASVTATIRAQVMGAGVIGTVAVDSRGDCTASLDISDTGHVEFLQIGHRTWTKTDKPIAGSSVPPGTYAAGTADPNGFTGFGFFCTVATDHSELRFFDPAKLTERSPSTRNGARERVLVTPDGETISITDTPVPYVARVVSGPKDEPYDITFGDWGKPLTLTPPPADQTVPLPASGNDQR